jgi:hypothetical protein
MYSDRALDGIVSGSPETKVLLACIDKERSRLSDELDDELLCETPDRIQLPSSGESE